MNREHTADDYLGTIKDPDERKSELRQQISDSLRDNQDVGFVQEIADSIIAAEDKEENTIVFYKSILKKVKPDGTENNNGVSSEETDKSEQD